MATPSTAPSTPEGKQKLPLNRSFTLPAKLVGAPLQAASADGSVLDTVETLFHHPNAAVFKFSTSPSATQTGRPSGFGSKERGLSWTSSREARVAVGPLEIYRVRELVSFLHSGDLLHAILPRSQSWCVDGLSKFAMRVMQDTYYRIELPAESPEDQAKVEELKKVLGTVMFYERSACPFARGFAEDLPEMEDISERKMSKVGTQWLQDRKASLKKARPPNEHMHNLGKIRQRQSFDAGDPVESRASLLRSKLRSTTKPAEQMVADIQPTRPAQALRSVTVPTRLQMLESSITNQQRSTALPITAKKTTTLQSIPTDMPPSPPYSSTGLDDVEDRSIGEGKANRQPVALIDDIEIPQQPCEVLELDGHMVDPEPDQPDEHNDRMKAVGNIARSVHSKHDEPDGNDEDESTVQDLIDRSVVEAEETMAQDDPVQAALDVVVSEKSLQYQDSPESHDQPSRSRADTIESVQSVVKPAPEIEDPFAAIQARILARRSIGGTTSFYPSVARESTSCSITSVASSSTVSSTRSHSSMAQRNLATALVKKACDVFLGPPAHLVLMMLRIAARFSKGTLGKTLLVESPSGSTRRIPGSFSVSEDAFGEGVSDEEDDFGVPFQSPIRVAATRGLRERNVHTLTATEG